VQALHDPAPQWQAIQASDDHHEKPAQQGNEQGAASRLHRSLRSHGSSYRQVVVRWKRQSLEVSYMGPKYFNGLSWQQITREERVFCAELELCTRRDPESFIELLQREAQVPNNQSHPIRLARSTRAVFGFRIDSVGGTFLDPNASGSTVCRRIMQSTRLTRGKHDS
jgi:hypothetical protein